MAAMFGPSWSCLFQIFHLDDQSLGYKRGYADGEIVINPTQEQAEQSLLELTVAGTSKHAINMVESGAEELSEEIMLEALLKGHEAVKELIAFQEEIVAARKEKAEAELLHADLRLKSSQPTTVTFKKRFVEGKLAREAATQAVKDQVTAVYEENMPTTKSLDRIMRDVAEILNKWNTQKCAV